MPGAGWLSAVGAPAFAGACPVGLILVGSPPPGTASNVMAFLAKGDVALSVAVASVSTLIAPVVTPLLVLFLFLFLAGSFLEIDAGSMVLDIVKTVLLPVIAGLLPRRPLRDDQQGLLEAASITAHVRTVLRQAAPRQRLMQQQQVRSIS
ncbi:bile acid:sodium symporter family protein [Pseudarthrobacter sp. NBSH8]|uniref:bile acid:sodium symporter family protein n=1 Tax=Pseudarthrobacter sp. NBSH8 TaxID=2596911 RepID=UPI00351B3F30